MNRKFALTFALMAFLGGSWKAQAGSVALADWCVNLNGNTSAACNGGGSGNASISLASFDQTLSPGTNNLGSITITLGQGNNQYVSFYADYDVDFATYGSFDDSANIVNGAAQPANYTYELSDPNSSNLFSDFSTTAAERCRIPTLSGRPEQLVAMQLSLFL